MRETYRIPLLNLLLGITGAIELIDPRIATHQKRVAYIAFSLGREAGLSDACLRDLIVAGVLHDIGALSYKERLSMGQFETQSARHSEIGYHFLRRFALFSGIADIVRFHHHHYEAAQHDHIPLESQVLCLADRVETLIQPERNILTQVERITRIVSDHRGGMFNPELTDAFIRLALKESFWFSAVSTSLDQILHAEASLPTLEMDLDALESFTRFFAQLIDFRSRFTATHSIGVSACAEELARLTGFNERQLRMMRIAGYLHDLGKLGVPLEILEKPGRLTAEEVDVIKGHPFYTYTVVRSISGLEEIAEWGALHHERLNGHGYPFHYQTGDLSLGSRIVAVADVFVALCEDRPYRAGISQEKALEIITDMALGHHLDTAVVERLQRNLTRINTVRVEAQQTAEREYQSFTEAISAGVAL